MERSWHICFLLFVTILTALIANEPDFLKEHHQLLIVTTNGWEESVGALQLYERANDGLSWTLTYEPMKVVLGTAGVAWGIGLHPQAFEMEPQKREGDHKSPAGLFALGHAFGHLPLVQMQPLKVTYLHLDEDVEAVDDPLSCHYNRLVFRKKITPDWRSSEKMGAEPLYKLGLIIHHNFPNPLPYAGSAIFFHIWRGENSATAGCTAMSEENLVTMLFWLDPGKNPLLLQLPIFKYHELQKEWGLP